MKKKNIVCLGLMALYAIFGFESVFASAGDWVVYDYAQPENDDVRVGDYSEKGTLYRDENGRFLDLVFNNYDGGPLRLGNFGSGGCSINNEIVYTFKLIGNSTISIPNGDDIFWDMGFDFGEICFNTSKKVVFTGDGSLTVKRAEDWGIPELNEVYRGGDVYYEERKHYSASEVAHIGEVSDGVSKSESLNKSCEKDDLNEEKNIDTGEENVNENNANNTNSSSLIFLWIGLIFMVACLVISVIFNVIFWRKIRKNNCLTKENVENNKEMKE